MIAIGKSYFLTITYFRRKSSSARSLHDPLDEAGGRGAGNNVDADHFPSAPLDGLPSNDLFQRPIAPFHQDVGAQRLDDPLRCIRAEQNDIVDTSKRRQNLRPLSVGNNRPGAPLQSADRRVGVHCDDETISERPGGGQISNMPDMQKIKTAVGKDNLLPLPLERADFFLKGGEGNAFVILSFDFTGPLHRPFSNSASKPAIKRGSMIS